MTPAEPRAVEQDTKVQRALRGLGLDVPDPSWTRFNARRPKAELRRFANVPRLNGAVLGYVYFAQAEPGGPVKIGWAVNVRRRVKQVAREGSLMPGLQLLTSVEGIRVDEGRVHRALAAARTTAPIVSPRSVQWPKGRERFHPTNDVRRVVEAFGGRLL